MKNVYIPLEAKTSESEFKGIPVKEAFYTAGYPEELTEGYLAPMNHANTYVVDGSRWGISSDVLIRTGNALIGLESDFLLVDHVEFGEGNLKVYCGHRLPRRIKNNILSDLSLREDYKRICVFRGIKPPGQRILEALSEYLSKLTE